MYRTIGSVIAYIEIINIFLKLGFSLTILLNKYPNNEIINISIKNSIKNAMNIYTKIINPITIYILVKLLP